jgi:hypothetical protein
MHDSRWISGQFKNRRTLTFHLTHRVRLTNVQEGWEYLLTFQVRNVCPVVQRDFTIITTLDKARFPIVGPD